MIRRLITCFAVAIAVIGFVPAGSAAADDDESPNHPGGPPGSCVYWTTAPQVVDVSGTQMVTARTQMKSCSGVITSSSSNICIYGGERQVCQRSDGGGAGGPAVAYLTPYVPGTTYTAKGSGCMTSPQISAPHCVIVDPVTVTL